MSEKVVMFVFGLFFFIFQDLKEFIFHEQMLIFNGVFRFPALALWQLHSMWNTTEKEECPFVINCCMYNVLMLASSVLCFLSFQFLRNIEEELNIVRLEEEHLLRKIKFKNLGKGIFVCCLVSRQFMLGTVHR